MGGLTYWLGGELAPALLLHAGEVFVLQEPRAAQRLHQAFSDFAHVEIAGQSHQHASQIEIGLLPVETRQRFHQQRWNDEHRVGEVVPIADQQPGVVVGRRWHEVEIEAQAWQRLGQVPMVSQAGAALPAARPRNAGTTAGTAG